MTAPELHFLRLFPLGGVVLFPDMQLPLHVFEPRYQQLTEECLEEDEPFGVLLLRSGAEVADVEAQPYAIGTTAHIRQSEPLGGGRMSLLAVGGKRFKVHTFLHDRPYPSAEVEFLEDESPEDISDDLIKDLQQAVTAYIQSSSQVQKDWAGGELTLPNQPTELSYLVAQAFQGDNRTQQRFLEAETTTSRLQLELEQVKQAQAQLLRRADRQGPGRGFSAN
jgi:Lon protease-like protein